MKIEPIVMPSETEFLIFTTRKGIHHIVAHSSNVSIDLFYCSLMQTKESFDVFSKKGKTVKKFDSEVVFPLEGRGITLIMYAVDPSLQHDHEKELKDIAFDLSCAYFQQDRPVGISSLIPLVFHLKKEASGLRSWFGFC